MRILLGPELLWLLFYGAAHLLAKANVPPSKALDDVIVNLSWGVPLLALLTFVLWYVPVVEKQWLLLRVWVACLIGGHLVLEKVMTAYSEQSPGIGMAYIMGITCQMVALIAGSIYVQIRF